MSFKSDYQAIRSFDKQSQAALIPIELPPSVRAAENRIHAAIEAGREAALIKEGIPVDWINAEIVKYNLNVQ